MSEKLLTLANNILSLVDYTEKATSNKERLKHLNYILEQIDEIENLTDGTKKGTVSLPEKIKLSNKLNLDIDILEKSLSKKEENKFYSGNIFAKLSNLFFEPITKSIFISFPHFERRLHNRIMESGIRVISSSYISMMLLSAFLALVLGSTVGISLLIVFNFPYGVLLGIVLSSIVLIWFSAYPSYKINARKKELESEYPFIVNHLSALSKAGVKDIGLFRSLVESKYYHCAAIDIRRIVNGTTLLGFSLSDSIKAVSQTTPSRSFRGFLSELSEAYEKHMDINKFLTVKSRLLLSQYRLSKRSNKQKLQTLFNEVSETFSHLKFDKFVWLSIIGSITIISLDLAIVKESLPFFITLLALGTTIFWVYPSIRIYKVVQLNRRLETNFLHFTKEFRRKGHLLDVDSNFQELNPYTQKLMNQYKIGISLEKALQAFSQDTNNKMIQGAVAIALEAKKHGAKIPITLNLIVASKTTRNLLKMEVH